MSVWSKKLNRLSTERKLGATITYTYTYGTYSYEVEAEDSFAGGAQGKTTSRYDANNRLVVRETREAGMLKGTVQQKWKTAADLVDQVVYKRANDIGELTAIYGYDLGRNTMISYAAGSVRVEFVSDILDANGRVGQTIRGAYRSEEIGNPDDRYSVNKSLTYDNVGQLTVGAGFNGDGNPKSEFVRVLPGNRLEQNDQYLFQYDNDGNLVKKTLRSDPEHWWTYKYDLQHRLIEVHERSKPNSTVQERTTTYRYDAEGNLVETKRRNDNTAVVNEKRGRGSFFS